MYSEKGGEMTPAIAISIISVCVAVASFSFGMYQYLMKNKKEDTTSMTTVIVKLESIATTTQKIESSIEDLKKEVRIDHDALIKLTASVKAAWRAIDEIKETLGSKS